jgi:hypothetical protein
MSTPAQRTAWREEVNRFGSPSSATIAVAMLQSTTLEANDKMIAAAEASVNVKQRLGWPGYEPLPEHHVIEQTNKNLSLELHGRLDPKTGKVGPGDPDRVALVKQMLELPAGQADAVMGAVERTQPEPEPEPERRDDGRPDA